MTADLLRRLADAATSTGTKEERISTLNAFAMLADEFYSFTEIGNATEADLAAGLWRAYEAGSGDECIAVIRAAATWAHAEGSGEEADRLLGELVESARSH